MSDLERAQLRLEAAVSRLSAVLAGGRGDNAAAAVELERVKTAHESLKSVTASVARRLDTVIERLASVTDEGLD